MGGACWGSPGSGGVVPTVVEWPLDRLGRDVVLVQVLGSGLCGIKLETQLVQFVGSREELGLERLL